MGCAPLWRGRSWQACERMGRNVQSLVLARHLIVVHPIGRSCSLALLASRTAAPCFPGHARASLILRFNITEAAVSPLFCITHGVPPRPCSTENERNRRRDLVAALRSRREQMLTSLKREAPRAAHGTLLGGASASGTAAAGGRGGRETEATAELGNRGLLAMQQQVMQQQDEALESLERSVVGTKHIALQVGRAPGPGLVACDACLACFAPALILLSSYLSAARQATRVLADQLPTPCSLVTLLPPMMPRVCVWLHLHRPVSCLGNFCTVLLSPEQQPGTGLPTCRPRRVPPPPAPPDQRGGGAAQPAAGRPG